MRSEITRFLKYVDRSGECWLWTGQTNKRTGRAYFKAASGRNVIAARWFYMRVVGPLTHGECVLHECDNVRCVNPAHLWVGSQIDNIRDRDVKGRNRLRAIFCKNGHDLNEENVRLFGPDGKWRACRACLREGMQRYRAKNITRLEAEKH